MRNLSVLLLLAALVPGGPALAQDAIPRLRAVLGPLAGVPLPPAAAQLLSGLPERAVVVYPPTNEIWLLDHEGRNIAALGRLESIEAGGRELLTVQWPSGPRDISLAELTRLLGRVSPASPKHSLAACHDRLAGPGGVLQQDAGPLKAGWRFVGRVIFTGDSVAGRWLPLGNDLRLILISGEARVPCLTVQAALGPAPPPVEQLAGTLSAILLVLEDGNAALDRIAEYQQRLAGMARGDPAGARNARLDIGSCHAAATLTVICDQLPASFRPLHQVTE